MELVWVGQPLHGAQETPGAGLNGGRPDEDNICSEVEMLERSQQANNGTVGSRRFHVPDRRLPIKTHPAFFSLPQG
jgi:hypothetical protein